MVPVLAILIAFLLPTVVLLRLAQKKPLRRPYLFSVGSFVACSGAMIQEIYTIRVRLLAGDIGGIEDTIGAVLVLCILLLVLPVILNLIALVLSHKNGEKV